MELKRQTWRQRLRRNFPAIAVLVLGLTATALATRFAWFAANQADRQRFEEHADHVVGAIQVRIDAYISALYGTRAYLDASNQVERLEFRTFVTTLEVNERYEGIQGIGFAQVLGPGELDGWERARAAEGLEGVKVFPREPARELYSAITYLEPNELRNRRALGFDMLSEPVRREAMLRAKQSGEPAASGRVTLLQEIGAQAQPGFLIYLAVYRGAREHVGWVYSPFRAYDLLTGIFPHAGQVDFQVYAGTAIDPGLLLYDDGGPEEATEALTTRRSLEIAGVPWTLDFRARPQFLQTSPRGTASWVAALGVFASLLLFAVARLQARARGLAEARQRRTSFLAEAARVLNESLDYHATLERIAHLCVRNLADWCVVHLVGSEGVLEDVAVAHRDPAMTQLGREASQRFPRDPSATTGVVNVVRTGLPELMPVVPEELLERAAKSAEHLALLRRVKLRSYMCVPLESRGTIIGAITFAGETPGEFGPAELGIAEELSRLAASAVDNSRLYHRAQQAVKIRDEFLSVASHELKTPITSMTLKLDAMKRLVTEDANPRWRRSEEVLERQIRRLTRLVDSLLDVSRIAAGRLRLEVEPVDLVATAREVAVSLQDELQSSPGGIEIVGPPALVGDWDRMRTEQVITNLLTNAIKYGEGKPITLTLEDLPDRARIVVRDRGIGISRDDLDRVFERFERAVPATNYGGLGLGLYIARQIVEALGGTIVVESVEKDGSTFTVELPKNGRPLGSPEAPARTLPH